jgi:hypothetical protein
MHLFNRDLSDRIWRGHITTVAETRKNYDAAPSTDTLLAHTCALFSGQRNLFGRERPAVVEELIALRYELLRLADALKKPDGMDRESHARFADRMDTLSAHLLSLSRRTELAAHERRACAHAAEDAVARGLIYARPLRDDASKAHTSHLLGLTLAELALGEGRKREALIHLNHAIVDFTPMQDRRQRARVYRKAGFLLGKLGNKRSALYWGLRAVLVFPVPPMVTVKSLGSLLLSLR